MHDDVRQIRPLAFDLVYPAMVCSENYSPPVLYALAATLLNRGRKDEAMFRFSTPDSYVQEVTQIRH
ncbi:MAG: hypothetical protein JKY67_15140 [Pseudomonadales bacterium]|nr:hypothetical protein [Pseudomonadales bacterium]